jgi:hypothetical protein
MVIKNGAFLIRGENLFNYLVVKKLSKWNGSGRAHEVRGMFVRSSNGSSKRKNFEKDKGAIEFESLFNIETENRQEKYIFPSL